ncbi:MAG: Holliday junction resolvase RuvX [Chloroflexi bacterium]|nr:Holliday junction resolvase RuvX [Chloroflexota bacterium]
MRIAALDVGGRRIGFALADPTGTIVSRTGAFQRGATVEADLDSLAAWIVGESVHLLIVGHPVHLSGHTGSQALEVEAFACGLEQLLAERAIPCQVKLWDERLTSVMAERYLLEIEPREHSRKREKGRVDAIAAGIILQGYLERNPESTW